MNREILFRGKQPDNGKWKEGGFFFYNSVPCIMMDADNPYAEGWYWMQVVPETVGQYTGLTDKNGKKIFEGDIVRHYHKVDVGEPDDFVIGLVRWNEKFLSWERTSESSEHFPYDFVRLSHRCVYEVVGNIHDDPELLKGDPHEKDEN